METSPWSQMHQLRRPLLTPQALGHLGQISPERPIHCSVMTFLDISGQEGLVVC